MEDAASSELDPQSKNHVIVLMPEQNNVLEKGGTMRLGAHEVLIDEGSLAYSLYHKSRVWERHRHRYEVNPRYIPQLTSRGMKFSGKSDSNRRMEILELSKNKFHFATQFHAEFKSRPTRPSPPYYGLVQAALESKTHAVTSEQVVAQSSRAK
jgi:CTP synthase